LSSLPLWEGGKLPRNPREGVFIFARKGDVMDVFSTRWVGDEVTDLSQG
jgi:hypothetical protein